MRDFSWRIYTFDCEFDFIKRSRIEIVDDNIRIQESFGKLIRIRVLEKDFKMKHVKKKFEITLTIFLTEFGMGPTTLEDLVPRGESEGKEFRKCKREPTII